MSQFAPFRTWIPVVSSNVKEIRYDPEKEQLAVRFIDKKTGWRTYVYSSVSMRVFIDFLNAPSKGQYVWKHIRDRYVYMEL